MNYYIEDFTESNYARLLGIAKEKYNFIQYEDVYNYRSDEKFILWRHDVDLSIHRSRKLAEIEAKFGVKATYFIQLNSNFYNIFEYELKLLLSDIVNLGHNIGVHFDPMNYQIKDVKSLEYYLSFEKNILKEISGIEPKVFSFHNPNAEILKYENYSYAGMVNTYAKLFKKSIDYCSDSNGYWRHERLEDVLEKASNNLQVLTHPGWWQEKPMIPYQRVLRCIEHRKEKYVENYNSNLNKLGRINVKEV